MDGFLRSRNYFARRLLAAAQDERNELRRMRTEGRELLDSLEDLTENELVNIYRLTKGAAIHLCDELRELTNLRPTQRISLETKVLTALFFYASGSYQQPVGAAQNLSQKMCSVYIEEVTQALNHTNMIKNILNFPRRLLKDNLQVNALYTKYGIPSVIGAIDCSHFHIFGPPRESEHLYFCRKQFYSLNV